VMLPLVALAGMLLPFLAPARGGPISLVTTATGSTGPGDVTAPAGS